MDSLTPSGVALSVGVIFAISKSYSFISSYLSSRSRRSELSKRAQDKRNARNLLRNKFRAAIDAYLSVRESKLSSEQCVKIAHMSASDIAKAIKDRTIRVADVVAIFSSRCIKSGDRLDIVAEEMYDQGLEQAKAIDKSLSGDDNDIPADIFIPSTEGVLFGVPVSIKDHIDVKGMDSTCGLAVRCFDPANEDAVVVQLLRKAGAIPIVRGNVPQCIMLPESGNLIWGQSKNPWNTNKTPGGSSGGDAALVATRSVPIAIGSDIGGSIRIPSQSCGVYGFKPTPGRISYKGCAVARPSRNDGQQVIKCTVGPLANCVEDLALVLKAWLVPEMSVMDPTIPYTGFDTAMFTGLSTTPSCHAERAAVDQSRTSDSAPTSVSKKLKIGYFDHDGYVDSAPTAKRAVADAVQALRARGHECVPFQPPSVEEAAVLYLCILGADGGMRGFFDGLEGEELHPMYNEVLKVASLPNFLRPLVSTVMNIMGETRSATLVSRVTDKSTYDHWADVSAMLTYVKLFTDKWNEAGLDAVVCPGFHSPAFNHDTSGDSLPLAVSCFLWNVLHFPVGSVPVTTVNENEDDMLSSAKIKDRFTHFAHYSMQGSKGLPFGVQVAALPYRDELALRVMKDLQDELKTSAGAAHEMISPFTKELDMASETH